MFKKYSFTLETEKTIRSKLRDANIKFRKVYITYWGRIDITLYSSDEKTLTDTKEKVLSLLKTKEGDNEGEVKFFIYTK